RRRWLDHALIHDFGELFDHVLDPQAFPVGGSLSRLLRRLSTERFDPGRRRISMFYSTSVPVSCIHLAPFVSSTSALPGMGALIPSRLCLIPVLDYLFIFEQFREIRNIQKCVTLERNIDKRGLHARQDLHHPALVQIANNSLIFIAALYIEFRNDT